MKTGHPLAPVPAFSQAQIESLADPAFAVDREGRIVVWNRAATLLLGWGANATLGATCSAILQGRSPDGQECTTSCPRIAGLACPGANCGAGGAHPNLRVRALDGRPVEVTVIELAVLINGRSALLHILRTVSEFQRDPLTGLVGRNEVAQALSVAQSSAQRTGEKLSAALVDVDYLKRINDHYGHSAGDTALKHVADTLLEGRRHDHVARWGGDEFLVLAAGATPEAMVFRLNRCIAILHAIHVAPQSAPLSISVGVTEVHPDDHIGDIVARADKALYLAKQQRGTVVSLPFLLVGDVS